MEPDVVTARPYKDKGYIIEDRGQPIAAIKTDHIRRATVSIGTERFNLRMQGIVRMRFSLSRNDAVVATGRRLGFFSRAFEIQVGDRRFLMRPMPSFWHDKYDLLESGARIGGLMPMGGFGRKAELDFPEELALPLQVFFFWLFATLPD